MNALRPLFQRISEGSMVRRTHAWLELSAYGAITCLGSSVGIFVECLRRMRIASELLAGDVDRESCLDLLARNPPTDGRARADLRE